MLSYFKIAGAVFAVLALGYAGWTANGWRIEAARAKALNAQLIDAQVRKAAAERAREQASRDLAEAETNTRVEIKTIVKKIPVYVDRNNCAVSVDGVRALNTARGVPATADGTTR